MPLPSCAENSRHCARRNAGLRSPAPPAPSTVESRYISPPAASSAAPRRIAPSPVAAPIHTPISSLPLLVILSTCPSSMLMTRRLGTVVRLLSRRDLNSALQQPETSQSETALLYPEYPARRNSAAISLRLDLLPVPHRPWQRIDLRRIAEDRRAEPPLNDPVVLDIEVREEDGERHRQNQERHQRRPQHRIARQPANPLARLPIPLRDSDLNAHSLMSVPASVILGCPSQSW